MAQISLAKPSASSKKNRRKNSANTAQGTLFYKHGTGCVIEPAYSDLNFVLKEICKRITNIWHQLALVS